MTFLETLQKHGLELRRGKADVLQINVGLACNLACRHCHLEAGPDRREMMSPETVRDVIALAGRLPFQTVDITGGSPEFLPQLPLLISEIAPRTKKLIVRSNLVALERPESKGLLQLYRDHRICLAVSFPAVNSSQMESQRGRGVWEKSIESLRELNELGYGRVGTGLELDLVANPTGAFLPASQSQAERKFRHDLDRRYGISFTNLFTFANVPLGRFNSWLERSGNREAYLKRLEESFNPCTIPNLMCRTLVSVDWQGFLYDCDFNQAAGLPHGGRKIHVSEMFQLPSEGTPVPVGDHCFACTAGSGFT